MWHCHHQADLSGLHRHRRRWRWPCFINQDMHWCQWCLLHWRLCRYLEYGLTPEAKLEFKSHTITHAIQNWVSYALPEVTMMSGSQLWLGTMSGSVALPKPESVEVYGCGYHRKPCDCPGSGAMPGVVLESVDYHASGPIHVDLRGFCCHLETWWPAGDGHIWVHGPAIADVSYLCTQGPVWTMCWQCVEPHVEVQVSCWAEPAPLWTTYNGPWWPPALAS